jgi:hypothetical protein
MLCLKLTGALIVKLISKFSILLFLHFVFCLSSLHLVAQVKKPNSFYLNDEEAEFYNKAIFSSLIDSNSNKENEYAYVIFSLKCKGLQLAYKFLPTHSNITLNDQVVAQHAEKQKLLQINGNITYDVFYRSRIDTPFQQDNLQQHTERVSLSIIYKEKYPFSIAFTARQSNSTLFRSFTDVNIHFDEYSYLNQTKILALKKLEQSSLNIKKQLDSIEALLQSKARLISEQAHLLNSPATLQQTIEKREQAYFSALNLPTDKILPNNNIPIDSDKIHTSQKHLLNRHFSVLQDAMPKAYIQKLQDTFGYWRTKFQDTLQQHQKKYDSLYQHYQQHYVKTKQEIEQAKNLTQLFETLGKRNMRDSSSKKVANWLASVKQFNIGRSTVNHSDLTANNIIITGVNAEFGKKNYWAICAGKIDYRFRDFFEGQNASNNQYLVMGRYGIGLPDKRAIILSVFQGRKSSAQFGISDSVNQHVNIFGYAIEAVVRRNASTFISAEVAKSTMPVTGGVFDNKVANSLIDFSETKNLAVSIKAETKYENTDTRFSGFFRRTGMSFQSFSLFTYATNQTTWQARIDQGLFRKKVGITVMLRQNDFSNPIAISNFKTTSIFKTVLLNIRVPKFPVISIGYFPATQLYYANNNRINANVYYILNASSFYHYKVGGLNMNTTFLLNKFFTQATDSGFVKNEGINIYAAQSLFIKNLQLKAGFIINRQPKLRFYTIDLGADYSFVARLKGGIGLKYNRTASGESYWGKNIMCQADFPKWQMGVQFQYEKNYLPNVHNKLTGIDFGRAIIYKNF